MYFGSGNVDGNWWVSTENNIQAALRFKDRATLATINSADGVAETTTGLCNPVCSGGPKAMWNYEFSLNTNANGGAIERDLTSVTAQLWVDIDPTAGTNWVVLDLFANWGDNEYSGDTDFTDGVSKRPGIGPVTGEAMVQQSANPMFANSGFGFLPGPGSYSFLLQVFDKTELPTITTGAVLLASVGGQIDVIPEPGSMALLFAAVLALFLMNRNNGKNGTTTLAVAGIRPRTDGPPTFARYGAAA